MWIGIARVKNEGDIIEAFIRHSACHFDKLLILDHASSDGTKAILAALVEEGLPLDVQHTDVFESQGTALTRLMRHAFTVCGADWVVPLDADEFVEVADGSLLRDHKPVSDDRTLEMHWNNFMYVPEAGGSPDLFARMTLRSAEPSELPKVAIPRAIGLDATTVIYEGNHFVACDGDIRRGVPTVDVLLCHFPIRSLEQYRLKVITGYLRYIINPSRDGQIWGWHYEQAYQLILDDKLDELETLMGAASLRYSDTARPGTAVMKPLCRRGGGLRYASSRKTTSIVAALARFSELIARDLHAAGTVRAKKWSVGRLLAWRNA